MSTASAVLRHHQSGCGCKEFHDYNVYCFGGIETIVYLFLIFSFLDYNVYCFGGIETYQRSLQYCHKLRDYNVYCFGGIETLFHGFLNKLNLDYNVYCFGGIETNKDNSIPLCIWITMSTASAVLRHNKEDSIFHIK